MKTCKYCAEQIADEAEVCPYCGEKQNGGQRKCPYCDEIIDSNSQVCPVCGEPLTDHDHQTQPQPAAVAQPNGNEKKKSSMMILLVIIIAILVGGVICLLLNRPSGNKYETDDNYGADTVAVDPVNSDNNDNDSKEALESDDANSDDMLRDMVCNSYLTDDDLQGISRKDLRIMRNAIFANHGYIFKSQDLREYFSQVSWYVPTTETQPSYDELSEIEQANLNLIKKYE